MTERSHSSAGTFADLYQELLEKESWEQARLVEEQWERFSRLIVFASRAVPYYRETLGIIDSVMVSEAEQLPIISRATVRDQGVRLVAGGVDLAGLRAVRTGGTTGIPITLYRDAGAAERERAHTFASWRRFGLRPDDRVAVIVARPVGGVDGTHKVLESTHTLWLGGDHLEPDLLSAHAARIWEYRPLMVRGYPSALSMLAQHITDNQLPIPDSVVVAGTSSEALYSWQADAITSAFRVPIANLYGQTEHVAFACSCPASASSLHVDTSYGLLEIVDSRGRSVKEPGVIGDVVGTGLDNHAAPLIRYSTGDRASWDVGDCGCGLRSSRLSKIDGRTVDVVIDSSGNQHRFSGRFYRTLYSAGSPLAKMQFRQEMPGVLLVTIRARQGEDPLQAEAWVHERLQHLDGFTAIVDSNEEFRSTGVGKQPLFFRVHHDRTASA